MRLLAIFAHPDDESFGPAGTLTRYAHEGHDVGLVTMTRGEAGSLGISRELGPERLAERRSEELRCAARILNIQYLKIYQLPDKKLAELPEKEIQDIIWSEINHFKPDGIITFHEDGISGHPDHKTVSRLVLKTVDEIQDGLVLFWFGITPEQADQVSERKMFPLNPRDITHRIEISKYLPQKKEAIHCHETQDELWQMLENTPGGYDRFASVEHFIQVRPLPTMKEIRSELF